MSPVAPLWRGFSAVLPSVSNILTDDFQFVPGVTPMATLTETLSAITLYYVVIFGGRKLMENRKPFTLQMPFIAHNLMLTLLSGGLLTLFLEQLIPTLWGHGVFNAICRAEHGWTNPLSILYYLNYLTKYLEFVDTVFLVLKKKPLTFLHTYHHGATAFLCYMQLVGQTPVSWVPIILNLAVHTVMYFYYFQSARGVRCWWKKYITVMQIVQFVIDLGFIYYCGFLLLPNIFPSLVFENTCDGGTPAAVTGVAILTSYLFLFVAFYFQTYKKPTKAKVQPSKQVAFTDSDDKTGKSRISQTMMSLDNKVNGMTLRVADRD